MNSGAQTAFMKLSQLAYLAGFGFRALVLRQKRPIIAGMPLTDVCNLQCKHCVVANVGRGHYPFARIEQLLQHFYALGVRIIYLHLARQVETLRGRGAPVAVRILPPRVSFAVSTMPSAGTLAAGEYHAVQINNRRRCPGGRLDSMS